MIGNFVSINSLTKTTQFSLAPVGDTEKNFNEKLLAEDELRAINYEKVKKYIDRYHKYYIENKLSGYVINGVREYAELYYKKNKTDKDVKSMENAEANMRKQIAKALTSGSDFKNLFGKELIKELLPKFLTEQEEKDAVEMFRDFTTYFTGFYTNRKNMYSDKAQTTSIAHRCINDNLPKFLDNALSFKKISANLPKESIEKLNKDINGIFGTNAEDAFSVDYFSFVLAQSGIDRYNKIIGGNTGDDSPVFRGLNQYINEYNQEIVRTDKSLRLPILKPLYKQILVDRENESFISEKFKNDNEVLKAVNDYYDTAKSAFDELRELFKDFNSFDISKIYITSGLAITDISNAVFGSWSVIAENWKQEYRKQKPPKNNKITGKYLDDERKAYKSIKSFSVEELQKLGSDDEKSITEYFKNGVSEKTDYISLCYKNAETLLKTDYPAEKKLCTDDADIEKIKSFLDGVKELEKFIKPLNGTGKEEEKDGVFYGKFTIWYEKLSTVDSLYNKVRNYLTQKPYSKNKIKLNFNIPNLLNGWVDSKTDSSDNGTQYGGYLFRKKNQIDEYDYFLGISANRKLFRSFISIDENDKSDYERLNYYQPKGRTIYGIAYKGKNTYNDDKKEMLSVISECANKYCSPEYAEKLNLSSDAITPTGLLKKIKNDNAAFYDKLLLNDTFDRKNKELIQNLKSTLEGMPKFKSASFILEKEYSVFTEVMDDIEIACNYKNYDYYPISKKEFDKSLNEDKSLYLFKITNKDLSYAETYSKGLRKSRGTDNLHTMYFKALMSGSQNVIDIGSGEVFFRKKSIEGKITHPKNKPVDKKDECNKGETSLFSYDLIKDKRFSVNQFSLHLSIILNYSVDKNEQFNLNEEIRKEIKEKNSVNIIGIDRGERNLLYVSVINEKGEILKQHSLNKIKKDNGKYVNYHYLLSEKEKERDNARKSWGTVENIKELKEGYMSQVVHKICEYVVKYDAVIAMEDLSFGFINSRVKVEKQVYQKFEKMLTDKLNYLVDKKLDPNENGGLLKAYQLTNKADGKRRYKQDGIIFYVPAWLTSKIDPVTGFVDLLKPKYKTVAESQKFFGLFYDIKYNSSEDYFEFYINYDKFPRGCTDYRKNWIVCTNGERIKTKRDGKNNNQFVSEVINLTSSFKELFEKAGIDYTNNLQSAIVSQTEKKFFDKLTSLLSLTLQMRNSKTGSTNPEDDYLISPVKDSNGVFYDSRNYLDEGSKLPSDADANGAYNIARKALQMINEIKNTPDEDLLKAKLSVKNDEWLKFAQSNE